MDYPIAGLNTQEQQVLSTLAKLIKEGEHSPILFHKIHERAPRMDLGKVDAILKILVQKDLVGVLQDPQGTTYFLRLGNGSLYNYNSSLAASWPTNYKNIFHTIADWEFALEPHETIILKHALKPMHIYTYDSCYSSIEEACATGYEVERATVYPVSELYYKVENAAKEIMYVLSLTPSDDNLNLVYVTSDGNLLELIKSTKMVDGVHESFNITLNGEDYTFPGDYCG